MLGAHLSSPGWSRLCLLLDYDGTLAPHGAHPDLTVLPPATREVSGDQKVAFMLDPQVLRRLADMPEVFVSVITGRCLPDIKAKVTVVIQTLFIIITVSLFCGALLFQVNIRNITYAGNHGLDIVHPDGTRFVPPLPEEVEEKASWLLQRLQAECCQVNGGGAC